MSTLQVRVCTSLDIISTNLSDLLALPDPEAAEKLNQRIAVWDAIDRAHERSFVERGIIIREFEARSLWRYLEDPETGQVFPHLTAWLSSGFLGCRRTNFAAKKAMTMLADVPPEKLLDVPASNIQVLTQLSTAVRNQPAILHAAATLSHDEFLEKLEREHSTQHIEARKPLSFKPGRSGAKAIEEAIAWALEHGIAGTRDEAIVRMAEEALDSWRLEDELEHMPAEEARVQ